MANATQIRTRFMLALERGMSTEEATVYANKFAAAGSTVEAPTETLKAKIVDRSHPLDHDGDGKPGGSVAAEQTEDLPALRAEYQRVIGKRPFPGWDAETLKQKIADASA